MRLKNPLVLHPALRPIPSPAFAFACVFPVVSSSVSSCIFLMFTFSLLEPYVLLARSLSLVWGFANSRLMSHGSAWIETNDNDVHDDTASECTDEVSSRAPSIDSCVDTRSTVRDFMISLDYQPPKTGPNTELRRRLQEEIAAWDVDVSATFTSKMLSASCNMAECCYGHLSFEVQYFIALYTAFTFYADDHCGDDPEPIGQFAQRVMEGAPQLDLVLDRFASHIKTAYQLWPRVAASAIVSGTFDSMSGMYIEYSTKDVEVYAGASRYPLYLRSKAGVGVPYAHFLFPSGFRDQVTSYIHLIPELDFFIVCANDILSFYKEELAGETDNFVHNRAAADSVTASQVLRDLIDETADTARRITALTDSDKDLSALWHRFYHGYIEFHVRTPRYRLHELQY